MQCEFLSFSNDLARSATPRMSIDMAYAIIGAPGGIDHNYQMVAGKVRFLIPGAEAMLYLKAKVVQPKIKNGKIEYFRLRLKLEEAQQLVIERCLTRQGFSAEDNKTSVREGRGYVHHTSHCEAFGDRKYDTIEEDASLPDTHPLAVFGSSVGDESYIPMRTTEEVTVFKRSKDKAKPRLQRNT